MKVSFRIDETLYIKLKDETKRFGYRSFSAYITTILEHRKILEIEGGSQLALAIFELLKAKENEIHLEEVTERICQLFDSLMIEIEELKALPNSANT